MIVLDLSLGPKLSVQHVVTSGFDSTLCNDGLDLGADHFKTDRIVQHPLNSLLAT